MSLLPWENVLDAAALRTLRETFDTDEDFSELLNEFVDASSQVGRDLAGALRAGEPRNAARAAHTLKSMARLLGARDLATASLRVERLASSTPRLHLPAEAIQAVFRELRRAQEAVARLERAVAVA